MPLGLSKPRYHRCSISGQGPDVLGFIMAKHVTVAVIQEHAEVRGSGRIPAILNRHDFSDPVFQIQPQGALVRLISGIALYMKDLFTHGPVFLCGFPLAPRSTPRPEK